MIVLISSGILILMLLWSKYADFFKIRVSSGIVMRTMFFIKKVHLCKEVFIKEWKGVDEEMMSEYDCYMHF